MKLEKYFINSIVTLIILIFLGLGFILYNLLIPAKTIIECSLIDDTCRFIYINQLEQICRHEQLELRTSDIIEIKYIPAHKRPGRITLPPNILILTRDIKKDHYEGYYILKPSLSENTTYSIAMSLNKYLHSSSKDNYYLNTYDYEPHIRLSYINIIILYLLFSMSFIVIDIFQRIKNPDKYK